MEWNHEQVEMMERGLRWAVEARRKGRGPQIEQTEGQERGEKVRFREEEQSDVMQVQGTDEREETSCPEAVNRQRQSRSRPRER